MKRNLFLLPAVALLGLGLVAGCAPDNNGDDPLTVVKEYTVVFNLNYEGSVNFDRKVEEGKTVSRPTDPIQAGHTFNTWVDTAGAAYDFSEAVTKDFVLKATWTKNSDWTVDEKDLMLDQLGEVIPYIDFGVDYFIGLPEEFGMDHYENNICIASDYNPTLLLTDLYLILENGGFELYDDYGEEGADFMKEPADSSFDADILYIDIYVSFYDDDSFDYLLDIYLANF